MEIKKLDEIPEMLPSIPVKVTSMGNVIELQYMSKRNTRQTIQMLPGGEQYVICDTGEVKDVVHHETRKDNKKGLYKTFARARALINTNVTDVSKVRWCTLTYAENMTDPKQLYKDFEKFNKRFAYYCKSKGYGKPEYIVMMEPQGRGAWHAHLLYIWQEKAPFIPNEDFRELWGHGFVKIKKLQDVDNVGAYLTAYLGDMEITEVLQSNPHILLQNHSLTVKEVDTLDDDGKSVRKQIIKGARLDMYPAGFKMIRHSKGVKEPIEELVTQEEARKKVLGATKTFESAIKLTDIEHDFETVIIKSQYNRIRK